VIPLESFRDARARVSPLVRRTPMLRLGRTRDPRAPADLTLKLELLQTTGSFKARGVANMVSALSDDARARGLVTASGGNHGAAVAWAGWASGAPAMVFIPESAPASKEARIAAWGAEVVRRGAVWDDAHAEAERYAASHNRVYVHPFADERIVAGQGTIALEIFDDAPETDLVVVAIGGGGLIAGVAEATRHLSPRARVVGVEPVGAPTLAKSLEAGQPVTLDAIATRAGTLAPRTTAALVYEIIARTVERVVLVTDDEMLEAARWLHDEIGVAPEISGAAAMAAVLTEKVDLGAAKHPCVLVCGSGTDGASRQA
jgi:threonine dehydratase